VLVGSLFAKSKKNQQHEFINRLARLGHSPDELATSVLALMVSATVQLSLALTNMVNLYLGSEQEGQIRSLVTSTPGKPLDGYAYEALRLDPPFQGVYRIASKDHTVGDITIKKDEQLFLDVAHANVNESVFSYKSINPARDTKACLQGDGLFLHLGEKLTVKIMTEVLRAVYGCMNVRRAPGQSGQLRRFKEHSRPEVRFAYLDQGQFSSPWPSSLTIQYDAK